MAEFKRLVLVPRKTPGDAPGGDNGEPTPGNASGD